MKSYLGGSFFCTTFFAPLQKGAFLCPLSYRICIERYFLHNLESRYGLQVIFHGCTLPRGWEVMYPNYVSSEAVMASENVYFTEADAEREAFDLCMHPFCRNALATMDWAASS
ncbi:MAG: glycoside hydrolase family 97 catalytic domain-containing protein [Bacteroidales bacterium]|nr:glycoside hydrolase family 97 catalytic domain-containing protein [Bacteroidales bacterium]